MPLALGDYLGSGALGSAAMLCMGGRSADQDIAVLRLDLDLFAIAQSCRSRDIEGDAASAMTGSPMMPAMIASARFGGTNSRVL